MLANCCCNVRRPSRPPHAARRVPQNPANVLLKQDDGSVLGYAAKIADFGLSVHMNAEQVTGGGGGVLCRAGTEVAAAMSVGCNRHALVHAKLVAPPSCPPGIAAATRAPQSHVSNTKRGTPFYTAPEVTHAGNLTRFADVFSYGVLLWELYMGRQVPARGVRLPACRPR